MIAFGLIAVSCASGSEASVTAVQADRSPGAATDPTGNESRLPSVEDWNEGDVLDDQPAPLVPLDNRFDDQPYAFAVGISLEMDGETNTFDLSGAVDPSERQGFIIGRTIDMATDEPRGDDEVEVTALDPDLELIQVMDGDESFARGLIPALGFPEDVEPQRWYAASPYTDDVSEMNILDQFRVIDDLAALLGSVEAEFENLASDDGVVLAGTLLDRQLDALRETASVFEMAPYADDTAFVATAGANGHITSVEFSAVSDEGFGEMSIEITGVGEPIVLPDVIDPTDPWTSLPIQPGDVTPFPDPAIPNSSVVDQTAPLRISTNGSYQVPGFLDVTYVVEADGDVLRITGGNIYTGPSGYTTWSLGPDGRSILEQLIQEFNLSGQYGSTEPGGNGGVRGTITSDGRVRFSVDRLEGGSDDASSINANHRRMFLGLLDRLVDLSDVPGIQQSEPTLWVPSRLAIDVSDEYNPQYYTTDDIVWPFERSIDEMASVESDGDRYVCLEGDDAALAWHTLLIDGVNNARIPISDGETTTEVGLRISYPGYHVGGNPCRPVDDVAGGSAIETGPSGAPEPALPVEIVDELLIEPTDLGTGWGRGLLDSVGSSPRFSPCPSATERTSHRAVSEFDGWMERTMTVTGPDGAELLQLVGRATPGADVDGIVDAIGPFEDCAQPLLEFGIDDFTSGDLTVLPAGVTAGSYWAYTDPSGRHELTADIALGSRYVMVLGYSAPDPISLAEIDRFVALAAANLVDLEVAVAACEATSPIPRGRCGGL